MGCAPDFVQQGLVEFRVPFECVGRDGADWHTVEEGPGEESPDLLDALFHHVRLDQVGLGQGDHPVTHAEEVHDLEVFDGLGHDAVVGRDDQQGHGDARDPGHHVLDEFFVPRHVHDPHAVVPAQKAGGEAEFDREAAFLLFLQAVGLAAGQEGHQRGFAVVHMPGGAEHHEDFGVFNPGRQAPQGFERHGFGSCNRAGSGG